MLSNVGIFSQYHLLFHKVFLQNNIVYETLQSYLSITGSTGPIGRTGSDPAPVAGRGPDPDPVGIGIGFSPDPVEFVSASILHFPIAAFPFLALRVK